MSAAYKNGSNRHYLPRRSYGLPITESPRLRTCEINIQLEFFLAKDASHSLTKINLLDILTCPPDLFRILLRQSFGPHSVLATKVVEFVARATREIGSTGG